MGAVPATKASNAFSPGKLLGTKWTAVAPQRREKHFLVTRLVTPERPGEALVHVEIEAVHSRRARVIEWRALRDPAVWRQGWQ